MTPQIALYRWLVEIAVSKKGPPKHKSGEVSHVKLSRRSCKHSLKTSLTCSYRTAVLRLISRSPPLSHNLIKYLLRYVIYGTVGRGYEFLCCTHHGAWIPCNTAYSSLSRDRNETVAWLTNAAPSTLRCGGPAVMDDHTCHSLVAAVLLFGSITAKHNHRPLKTMNDVPSLRTISMEVIYAR